MSNYHVTQKKDRRDGMFKKKMDKEHQQLRLHKKKLKN